MAQIDIQRFSGAERLPVLTRLAVFAAMIMGDDHKKARNGGGSRRGAAFGHQSKRLAGPVGRDAAYLRDLDIEIGF